MTHNVQTIQTDDIRLDWADNSRELDPHHLIDTIRSIYWNGLQEPPHVVIDQDGTPHVSKGFHRVQAIRALRDGAESIEDPEAEALVEDGLEALAEAAEDELPSDDLYSQLTVVVDDHDKASIEGRVADIVSNIHRKNPPIAAISRTVKELVADGADKVELAQRIGRGEQFVERCVMFDRQASKKLKELSEAGAINDTQAVAACRLEKAEQNQACKLILEEGVPPKQAVDQIRREKGQKPAQKRPLSPVDVAKSIHAERLLDELSPEPPTAGSEGEKHLYRGVLVGILFDRNVLGPDKSPLDAVDLSTDELEALTREAVGEAKFKKYVRPELAEAEKEEAKASKSKKKKGSKKKGKKKKKNGKKKDD